MLLRGRGRRFLALLLLSVIGLGILFRSPHSAVSGDKLLSDVTARISDTESATFCKKQHLVPSPDRNTRQIYDLLILNTELDLLEIRLHTLAPHVDHFIIVESTHTFTGEAKPLYFHSNFTNSPHFAAFATKIIHHTFHPNLTSPIDPWSIERAQRNSLLTALQSLPPEHPAQPHENDILLVSDIDELPRPSALALLRACTFPTARITLSTTSHLYSFSFIHSLAPKRRWLHPQATVYRHPPELTIPPEDLRTSAANPQLKAQYRVIGDAGWHCSSCLSTVAEMQAKIRGFSHQEFNHPVFLDPAQIVRRVRHGVDLAERKWEAFVRVDAADTVEGHQRRDIPEYLKLNADRFPWLIDRDADNARFKDWEGAGAGSLEEWGGPWPDKWPE